MTRCSRCNTERPRANLTEVDGVLLCPEDLYADAEYAIKNQKPIRHERS